MMCATAASRRLIDGTILARRSGHAWRIVAAQAAEIGHFERAGLHGIRSRDHGEQHRYSTERAAGHRTCSAASPAPSARARSVPEQPTQRRPALRRARREPCAPGSCTTSWIGAFPVPSPMRSRVLRARWLSVSWRSVQSGCSSSCRVLDAASVRRVANACGVPARRSRPNSLIPLNMTVRADCDRRPLADSGHRADTRQAYDGRARAGRKSAQMALTSRRAQRGERTTDGAARQARRSDSADRGSRVIARPARRRERAARRAPGRGSIASSVNATACSVCPDGKL